MANAAPNTAPVISQHLALKHLMMVCFLLASVCPSVCLTACSLSVCGVCYYVQLVFVSRRQQHTKTVPSVRLTDQLRPGKGTTQVVTVVT